MSQAPHHTPRKTTELSAPSTEYKTILQRKEKSWCREKYISHKRWLNFYLNGNRNWAQFLSFLCFLLPSETGALLLLFLAVLQHLHMQQGLMTIKYTGIENLLIINKVGDSLLFQYDVNMGIKIAFIAMGLLFVYLGSLLFLPIV